MKRIRIIPRLDIKGPNLIKGIHLEGLRVVGDPQLYAKKYYDAGADELIYMDIVASLYGRNSLFEIVKKTTQEIFIPLTVGGGIRSTDDVTNLLRAGADKVAVNTAAIQRPQLINEIASRFGSQCMVLSIEAKRTPQGSWEAYIDNGREHTGRDVIEWAQEGAERGAGEILLTSVDQEGTRKGFDVELIHAISKRINRPLIVSGGMGNLDHLKEAVGAGADAVAIAHILHYSQYTIPEIKNYCHSHQIEVRQT